MCLLYALIVALLCVNSVAKLDTSFQPLPVLTSTALFSLCSHHPWLSPSINRDKYLSVIIDLKTASALTVTKLCDMR